MSRSVCEIAVSVKYSYTMVRILIKNYVVECLSTTNTRIMAEDLEICTGHYQTSKRMSENVCFKFWKDDVRPSKKIAVSHTQFYGICANCIEEIHNSVYVTISLHWSQGHIDIAMLEMYESEIVIRFERYEYISNVVCLFDIEYCDSCANI